MALATGIIKSCERYSGARPQQFQIVLILCFVVVILPCFP